MSEVKIDVQTTVRRKFYNAADELLFTVGSGKGEVWISMESRYTGLKPADIPALIAALQAAATEAEGRGDE